MKARHSRAYPDLDVRDKVKIRRKKGIAEKQQTSRWTKTTHTITKIETKLGQQYYSASDFNKSLLRHEMLKYSLRLKGFKEIIPIYISDNGIE